MMSKGMAVGILSLVVIISVVVGAWISGNVNFLILLGGLVLGGLLGVVISKDDWWSRFLWFMAGAVPGWALILDEPVYTLLVLPILGLIAWRRSVLTRKQSA